MQPMFLRQALLPLASLSLLTLTALTATAQQFKYLTEVPDYEWHAGCFGTASGNLAGFWDRHGMTNFYSGPTGGGVAPLSSRGANRGIFGLWASQAGVDGRPAGEPGHIDDYWVTYESPANDPYVTFGRPEHAPDCIGDFIGLSQKKWTNMNDECDGNIDAFSFVFWDKTGNKRSNHYQTNNNQYVPDIPSGLREWAKYRGYEVDVFSQLPSFSPEKTGAGGFTYADMKAEINAGYPVLLFLQPPGEFSRTLGSMTKANPEIHGVMVWGYYEDPGAGLPQGIQIRTSWGSGDGVFENFANGPLGILGGYRIRGVIGFRPKPKIVHFNRDGGNISLAWDGPSSQLTDAITGSTTTVHRYQVEAKTSLNDLKWTAIGSPTTDRTATVPDTGAAFYRVSLLP
jgi:hypothetical protein